jgi:hypothetical protein
MKRVIFIVLCFCSALYASSQLQPVHTVMLILENHTYNQIVGNPQAPYINSVFNDSHTARLTSSYALTHPSQPNYIMLYSGSSQGVINNDLPNSLPFTTLNLGASMIQAGFSFTGYAEDLPYTGFNGEISGSYVRKHNPWVNWQGGTVNGIPATDNKPFSEFPSNFNSLPTLSIVVPNLDHDIHDGSIPTCDAWVQANLGAYIEWCKTNNSLFILTFDEDDVSADNKILSFFTGANIKTGNYNQRITHYNVLRTIEELYQLPYAGASADSTAIQNIWLGTLPVRHLEFNAVPVLNTIVLKWQTKEEHNTGEFVAERSNDHGQTWTAVATLPAAGTSIGIRNYTFTDIHPGKGINLYRIKQVDLNGNFIYSRTLAIEMGDVPLHYQVFPNPGSDKIFIATTNFDLEKITLELIDASGRIVLQKNATIVTGMPFELDVSTLKRGGYFLNIVNGSKPVTKKILLE